MEPEMCTSHASIDASRARALLEEAKNHPQRLHQLYSDCFFDGSIAAAESAVQFAIKETDSLPRAIELADAVKSLPAAIPVRTAKPLAEICAFLAFSFSEAECQAPLNTFCYAETVIRRAALRVVFERLHEKARMETDTLMVFLKRLVHFIDDIVADCTEIEGRIVIEHLVGLAYGRSSQIRREIFQFLIELDIRSSSSLPGKLGHHALADYDIYLTSELARLATDSESIAQILLRSLVRLPQYGTMDSLVILWTSHRAQMIHGISIIGRDSFLFLVLAQAVRLACHGKISDCRRVVRIAQLLLESRDGVSTQIHNLVRSILITFCASIGASSSAYRDEDLKASLAEILRCLRSANSDTDTAELVKGIRCVAHNALRWSCRETTAVLGLLLKIAEQWTSPSQLKTWIGKYLAPLLSSAAFSNQGNQQGTGTVATSGVLLNEESASQERNSGETFGALVTLLGVSILGHPVSCIRFGVVEALRDLENNRISLFCLPSVLIHLQYEKNGVVAIKVIRELLCSRSLLKGTETSRIALKACMQSLEQSTSNDSRNNASYETIVAALGYATESAPGLATSLLLKEVEKLNDSFSLTRGPVRASAASAILRLVKSRPSRGTNFIPFISSCIVPESMAIVPEAASLCFEAMNVMAEEEVLDPVKAVKIVMKNYPDVGDVEPKARRSYLKLLGAVSRGSSTKKGRLLAIKVIYLLRGCLSVSRIRPHRQGEGSNCFLSWSEVDCVAKSLGQFTVEEILRLAYANEEPSLDLESEAERKERIENECQEFVQEILSMTAMAHDAQQNAVDSLRGLLIKIVSHEWLNRQRSRFDPDRIAKLRAASDALRRARQARGAAEGDSVSGIDSYARAVKGLPTGVIKGVFQKCIWNPGEGEGVRQGSSLWVAIRVVVSVKAISRSLPWVPLVMEVLKSSSHAEERASCFAVLRASQDNSFELKEAHSKWFGAQSLLFDSSVSTSVAEASELFIGMVHFYPSEVVRLLFKFKAVTSWETVSAFIGASRELQGSDIITVAQGLFPAVMNASAQRKNSAGASLERDFYEIVLTRCEESFIEELLMNNITEPGAIRIACIAKSFNLLCHAARILLAEGGDSDLIAMVGLSIRSFDAAHRREFVLDVCSGGNGELRQRQYSLAAHIYGVAALLPYTDLALSVAACFCADSEKDGVTRSISSIMQ